MGSGGEFAETFSKHRTLIELLNFKLTENPPFFIHAVSGWAFHKSNL